MLKAAKPKSDAIIRLLHNKNHIAVDSNMQKLLG